MTAQPAREGHDASFFKDLTWLRQKYTDSDITNENITTMLSACEARAAVEMKRRGAFSRLKSRPEGCRRGQAAAGAEGSGDIAKKLLQSMVAVLGTCNGHRLDDPADTKSSAAAAALCLSRCSNLALGAQAAGAALGVIGDGASEPVAVDSASGGAENASLAAAEGASEPVRAQPWASLAFLPKANEFASLGFDFIFLHRQRHISRVDGSPQRGASKRLDVFGIAR